MDSMPHLQTQAGARQVIRLRECFVEQYIAVRLTIKIAWLPGIAHGALDAEG